MSVIQISQQTTLTGRQLQDAINAIIHQMRGMSPYTAVNLQSSWESGTRLTLRGGTHMTGAIDLIMGPPSTVTVQINLLSSLARRAQGDIERDMIALSNQHLTRVGAPDEQPTYQPPASPAAQEPSRPRPQVDWNIVGTVLTGLFGSAAQAVEAYNQVGDQAAGEAILIAQEEGGKVPSAIGPYPGLHYGSGLTLGQGKAVGPDAPLPGGRLPSEVSDDEGATPPPHDVGFPTWGWVAIGLGGVVAIGAVAYFMTRKDEDEFERNEDRPRRETRAYKKMSKIGGKSRKSREKSHPKGRLKREVSAMREAGYSVSEIASALGINREMARAWSRREGGSITGNYGFRYYL